MKYFVIAHLILILSPAAHAFNCMHRGLQEQVKTIITNIAVVDEDGRMTEEEYARKKSVDKAVIQDRFAATGILNCNGYKGSAQLTGDDQTITTCGHMFWDKATCKPFSKACTFTIQNGNDVQVIGVGEMVGTGFKCPKLPRGADDWAVLKLKKRAKNVRPYSLPQSGYEIGRDTKVISVAGFAVDFRRADSKTGKKIFPKSIEECETRKSYRTLGRVTLTESNCDFSGGNSGGSIIKESVDGDQLIAISAANSENETLRKVVEGGGATKAGPYEEGKWTTYHVPVDGEFLQTIENAIGGRSL